MWPFRKKPEPPQEPEKPGPLNEDWKVGDLAVAISPASDWSCPPNTDIPTQGTTYRVKHLRVNTGWKTNSLYWMLWLDGMNGNGYSAYAFRKVRQDEEECTTEFAETIKNLKPARVK